MEYKSISGLRKPLSRVIQGATTLFGEESVPDWEDLLDEVLAAGVNAFDTGLVYADHTGTCDGKLGQWIKNRGVRDDVLVIGKGCHPGPPNWENSRVTPECVGEDIEKTLDRMGTDRIDLWLFHRDDINVPIDELVDAIDKQVSAGLVDAWGVSNWGVNRFMRAIDVSEKNRWSKPEVFSPHFSLVHQKESPWSGVTSIAGNDAEEDRDWLRRNEIPVLAWSALAGGYLTSAVTLQNLKEPSSQLLAETARCYHTDENWSRRERAINLAGKKNCTLEQISISWILNADLQTHALCASRNKTEIHHNVASIDIELSKQEMNWLENGKSIE
tara:strand:+ start:1564 stop:2550 length:987 start_codon:yes stop_codon:yes gene_type:complete